MTDTLIPVGQTAQAYRYLYELTWTKQNRTAQSTHTDIHKVHVESAPTKKKKTLPHLALDDTDPPSAVAEFLAQSSADFAALASHWPTQVHMKGYTMVLTLFVHRYYSTVI